MMASHAAALVLAALGLAALPALGQTPARSEAADTQPTTSTVTRSGIAPARTPALADQRRRAWDLSEAEYARYQTLMRGVRGSFSEPTISPLEVLGIHARDPERRRRYAERLVRVMRKDTQRVLDFQFAVDAAWDRLYPNEPLFDESKLPPEHRPFNTTDLAGERLVAFVSVADEASGSLERLLTLASPDGVSAGLDLYVIDAGDDAGIRAWARDVGIDPELVRSRRITLNNGWFLYRRMGAPEALPQVFRREGQELVPVPGLMTAGASR